MTRVHRLTMAAFASAGLLLFLPAARCIAQGRENRSRDCALCATDTLLPALRPRDSFLGLDKPKHFLLSAFVECTVFSALQATGAAYRTDLAAAASVSAAAGVGKELHDRKTTGLFSLGDLFWDAAGAATAAIMLRHTYR